MSKTPNRTKFLQTLNNAVDHFIDYSPKFTKVITISHNDADGISSLHIIQNLLYKLKCNYDYFIYNRSLSWDDYLSGIFSRKNSEKTCFILTDVGSSLAELIPIIKERNEFFYILDHHEVDKDDQYLNSPENLHFVNPTLYGFDGLDHISGATLAYMFAKRIKHTVMKQGWLTLIGIAGDSLKSMDNLESFNKEIYDELLMEEVFTDKEGLILFGSMHETIKNGLKYSILPYIEGLGGESDTKIIKFLSNLNIDPEKKVVDLNDSEIEKIEDAADLESKGHYALLPQKQGILEFAFEHALLLNILCFKNISSAISMIQNSKITRYAKNLYYNYVGNLSRDLRTLSKELPRDETKKAIFIEVRGKIAPSNWSDTASFASVNELLDPYKMLFVGGLERKSGTIKLSIRCTRKYLKRYNGIGVNTIISKIKQELGGMGGGHKLAGGIRLSRASYKRLKKRIDNIIV
jgi:RecJ-like exonuclease